MIRHLHNDLDSSALIATHRPPLASFVLWPVASLVIPRSRRIVLFAPNQGTIMKNRLDRMSGLVAMCGLAAAVAVTTVLRTGRAQEAAPSPPPVCAGQPCIVDHPLQCPVPVAVDHLHRVIMNDKGQVTVFVTKLPELGSVLRENCQGQTCCEELLQRIEAA